MIDASGGGPFCTISSFFVLLRIWHLGITLQKGKNDDMELIFVLIVHIWFNPNENDQWCNENACMLGGDDSRGPVLQNYTMSPHTNTKKGWEKGTWVVHNAEMTCQSE